MARHLDPVDGDGTADPFSVRDIHKWADKVRRVPKGKIDWMEFSRIVESLNLTYPRENINAQLMTGLAGLFIAFVTGEASQTEDGVCAVGDLATEVADLLYKHVADVERTAAKREGEDGAKES